MLEKPGGDASPWEKLGYGFCMMDDERKETCIHCREEWYSKHYKDGVCHSCGQKGLPGRSVLYQRKMLKNRAVSLIPLGVALLVWLMLG